jgi:hypothetical protein
MRNRRHCWISPWNWSNPRSFAVSGWSVAAVVAVRAALPEFLDDRSTRLLEGRIVVAFEEVGRAAVDTAAVALVHDAALTNRRMTAPTRRIDRPALRVMDQRPQERRRCDPLDDGARNRCPVIERAAIAPHVDNDLGDHPGAATGHQRDQRIRPLLRNRRPPRRVRGRARPVPAARSHRPHRSPPPHPRRKPKRTNDHPVESAEACDVSATAGS